MTILDFYQSKGIEDIITQAEAVFGIEGSDYEVEDFKDVMRNIKKRINRDQQIDLGDKKLNDISFETGIYKTAVALYLDSMAMIHMKLTAQSAIDKYTSRCSVRLSKVNWFGFTRESILRVLVTAQLQRCMPKIQGAISRLEESLPTINFSTEKRLVLIMCVAYELGVYEIVSAVAEIMYFGGRYDT